MGENLLPLNYSNGREGQFKGQKCLGNAEISQEIVQLDTLCLIVITNPPF